MLKKSENNGTEEIGLVTPTPVHNDAISFVFGMSQVLLHDVNFSHIP